MSTSDRPSPSRPDKSPLFSLVAAWALAFGCAVGWDAVSLPGTTFLPKAGPLGTLVGLLLGGLVMAIIARNFHFMVNHRPGPGGVYSYAAEAFGSDHGFICAWFLCLTYVAIVWVDATAIVLVARHILGDVFRFGFSYTVLGSDVCLGYILVAAAAIAVAAVVCCRRWAAFVQTALCVLFLLAVFAAFGAALKVSWGGFRAMAPAFSPLSPTRSPVLQVLSIVAISPWLFVGFEAISNLSGDPRFPLRRSFAVMVAAILSAIAVYALLAAVPALAPFGGAPDWATAALSLGDADFPAIDVAARPLGRAAVPVLLLGLVTAVFTNLVGNTVAASRLLAAMADDGALPAWFGGRNRLGAPRNAILAIAALSLGVSALGNTALGVIVDIAIVGAGIAYAYTSAATFKIARQTRNRPAAATGLAGLLLSLAISAAFVLPNFAGDSLSSMATQSYLVVVLWCIAGLFFFLSVFRRDREHRFGQSTVVWLFLLAAILLLSLFWIRQSTYDTTSRAFDDIVRHHAEICIPAANGGPSASGAPFTPDALLHDHAPGVPCPFGDDWRDILRHRLLAINRSIIRNSLVQLSLTVLSFALMLYLFAVLRRRERELELEKARAKSYFFSAVSHDIRTPLNAIIGYSEMLRDGLPAPADRRQALDSILVSGKTLLGLVNDVLDLSKLESGKMEIFPEPTDCPRLLREIVDTFRIAADKPHLDLRCRVAPMPPLLLDPQRLRQIVFNLVGNAVKFTDTGFVELRASFNRPPHAASGLFHLEVEDTGPGLSDTDKRRIGAAYVQVGSKSSRAAGTGLGLAICSQLAAAMGGSLTVVSALGRGSTFAISIPYVEIAPPSASPSPSPDGEGDLPAPLATPSAPVRRVLLVDDSKMNLMVLRAHLKHLGSYEIDTASDGLQALQILQNPATPPFDLVFTDLWMPNLDGEGLVRAIRSDPKLASLRVVVVTADVELRDNPDPIPCDAILYKPVTSVKLARLLAIPESR